MTTRLHSLYKTNKQNGLFVIADLGLTNGGCLHRAYDLIETAANLGVHAVKFQMIDAGELLGDKSVTYTYPTLKSGNKIENMYNMFRQLEYSDAEWMMIKQKCDDNKIGLIVTAHVLSAVKRLEKLELPVNKICTWSLSHYEMIAELAKNNKPLMIDTGTITLRELQHLEEFYKLNGGDNLIILYDFHTNDPTEMHFNAIRSLVSLGYEVGYTPQGRQDWLDYMSIGLGVSILEKRLTLSRVTPANGHWKALEPQEFCQWIENVHNCATSLGEEELQPTKQDILDSQKYYKSAWLATNVKKGQTISADNFVFKRPGKGIGSKQIFTTFVGKKFQKDYCAGELFDGALDI